MSLSPTPFVEILAPVPAVIQSPAPVVEYLAPAPAMFPAPEPVVRERETLPCVRSKRFGVYFQKARVLCDTGVLNVTYTQERFSVQDKKKRTTHTTQAPVLFRVISCQSWFFGSARGLCGGFYVVFASGAVAAGWHHG